MVSFTVSHLAYLKIALHAAKYPHKQVNGVLLGSEVSNGVVDVVDAVPLLHLWTSLSPSMEIGLDLARNHAQSLDLQVVGYYQASERVDDLTLAPVGERVAETIRQGFPNAVTFVVDGAKLGSGEPALQPYLPQGTLWRPTPPLNNASQPAPFSNSSSQFKLQTPNTPQRVLQAIRERKLQQKFGDFDDHLEDVKIDWLRNAECRDD